MAAAVSEGGKASQAGVKAGDVLVSIDGRKDFAGLSADEVNVSLVAPVRLVFLGFVGKLHAEVRLNYKERVCGLSSKHELLSGRPEAPMQVVDEVVFKQSNAALLLTTRPQSSSTARPPVGPYRGASPMGDDGAASEEEDDEGDIEAAEIVDIDAMASNFAPYGQHLAAVYELRGNEARRIVDSVRSRTVAYATSSAARSRVFAQQAQDHRPRAGAARFPDAASDSDAPDLQGGAGLFGRRQKTLCEQGDWFGQRCQ